MRLGVFDDMRRKLMLPQPLKRVVSLVPSDTETLFALGLGDTVVGRTRYCIEPASQVEEIAVVGGTKDVDIEAVLALAPDLVLANQEENSRANLEALAEAGAMVFVSFPKRYADAIAHMGRLARMFGINPREGSAAAKELIRQGYACLETAPVAELTKVFVPIWMDPMMTFSDNTYSHEILHLAGAVNVFADRKRKYPLKADLGMRSPLSADQVANRDKRYPRITEEELIERAPELVLLPNEPYEFSEKDHAYFSGLDIPAAANGKVLFVDGKDLFWPGARSVHALGRLTALIAEHAG